MELMDEGFESVMAMRRVRALAEEAREAEDVGGLVEWVDGCMGDAGRFLVYRDMDGTLRGVRIEAEGRPLTYLDTLRGCVVCEARGREVRVPLDPALARAIDGAAEYTLG